MIRLLQILVLGAGVLGLFGCESSTDALVNASSDSNGSSDSYGSSDSGPSVSSSSTSGFDPCRFNFGAQWHTQGAAASAFTGLNHLTVWLGDNNYFNRYWEGEMVDTAIAIGATPVFYAYVIAEYGKDQKVPLSDCDVNPAPNLCTEGALLIRKNFNDSILDRYRAYASGLREFLIDNYSPEMTNSVVVDPDTYETIWLIEPDFYQYSVSGSAQDAKYDQMGGAIPDAEMGAMFRTIVETIHTYLPAAKIAIDISPWAEDQASWYSNFDLSLVDYASTSGGGTSAATARIRSKNPATWAGIHELLGKPIIADAGYDAGGSGTGHSTPWDKLENIQARMADGVVGITQMDAALDYVSRLAELRAQLSSTTACAQ